MKLAENMLLKGVCCPGWDWEVIIQICDWWGICQNPFCPVEVGTHYHGVSHFDEESLVERMEVE